jgi:hypothetical protein
MILHCDKRLLFAIASHFIPPADVLLDIGCGLQPTELVTCKLHVAAEPFSKYIEIYKNSDRWIKKPVLFLNTDWSGALSALPCGTVDVVCLIDVIEHLEKDEGQLLLRRTIDELDPKCLVIFTPLGFLPQFHANGVDAWGVEGGAAYQEHKSGWTPDDFPPGFTFLVSSDFHSVDNRGRILTPAVGAFFAIYKRKT